MTGPEVPPFRRRCGWCGVVLRWWQANLCRRCRAAVHSDGCGILSSPPCVQASRWDAAPDALHWKVAP